MVPDDREAAQQEWLMRLLAAVFDLEDEGAEPLIDSVEARLRREDHRLTGERVADLFRTAKRRGLVDRVERRPDGEAIVLSLRARGSESRPRPEGRRFQPLREDLWRAFTFPDPSYRFFYDRDADEIVEIKAEASPLESSRERGLREAVQADGERYLALPRPSSEEQVRWLSEWPDPPHQLRLAIEGVLSRTDKQRAFHAFLVHLRRADAALGGRGTRIEARR